MKHRTVRCTAAAKMMTLDETGKATALAGSDDVHQFVRIENVHHHLIAGIRSLRAFNSDLTRETGGSDIRLFKVPRHRLIHALGFDELDKAELDGIVSVLLLRLSLNHDARARLNDGDRDDTAVLLQQLRHSNFLA